jgi:hypothetical protein
MVGFFDTVVTKTWFPPTAEKLITDVENVKKTETEWTLIYED